MAVPAGGVKTVVLFFEKGAPTRKIGYYRLDLSVRTPTATKPSCTAVRARSRIEIARLDAESAEVPGRIRGLI